MRRAPGTPPLRRRSSNFHMAAFAAHRHCRSRDMTYEGDMAVCHGGCNNRWRISRDSNGEPIGYTLLPRVNREALVS